MFIGFHNVLLASYWMVVTTSLCVTSWHDNVRACALTVFVPYPLRKFILTSYFSYWWLWHLSVINPYHLLSADYVRVRLVHLSIFLLCIHAVSYLFSSCLHYGFNSSSFCLQEGFNFSLFGLTLTDFTTHSLFEGGPICRVPTCFHPMIPSQNFTNRHTCRAFAKTILNMCYVLQYAIDFFCFNLSLANK